MNYLSIILKYMNNVSMSLYRAHLNNIDNIEKNCHFIGFYMKICLTIIKKLWMIQVLSLNINCQVAILWIQLLNVLIKH